MKRICMLLVVMLVLPMAAMAEDWTNVGILDTQCSTKSKANPDAHTRDCALMCQKSGFGIVDKDGNYLKFDARGNQQTMKLLQSTSKADHLRVDVSGTREGDVIHVSSVKLL